MHLPRGIWLAAALLVAGCGTSAESLSSLDSPNVSAPASAPASTSTTVARPASDEQPWRLVAIGDSIPFGSSDCGGCVPFPQRFGDWIESTNGRPVEVTNLAQHDNLTAARLADELPRSEQLLDALRQADIITITIGHNDTPWNAIDDSCDQDHGFFDGNASAPWDVLTGPCLDTEVERYRENLEAIFAEITDLRSGRPTAIRFTTQYADIPGDPCCPPEATSASTVVKDRFNTVACEVAALHDIMCIDVYHAFNGPDGSADAGPLLAGDHTHPSADGQQAIADLLADAGLSPLA